MTHRDEKEKREFTFYSQMDEVLEVEMESDDMEGLHGWAKVDVVTTWEKIEGDGLTEPRYGSRKVRLDVLRIDMWMGENKIDATQEHEEIFKEAVEIFYL